MSEPTSEKPGPVGEDAPETPYRTPPPPCPACEAREKAATEMVPFEDPKKVDRVCPECRSVNVTMYSIVCRGNGAFILTNGFWLFRRWGRKVFTCQLPGAPRHFHFRCMNCQHRWLMLTATEKSG